MEARDHIENDRLVACSAGAGLPGIEAAALPAAPPTRLERLLALDAWLLLAMRHWQGPWRTRLALALTRMGDASSWTVAALALLATGTTPGIRLGLRLAAATLLATAVSQTLKRWLLRPRPTRAIAGFTALAENPDAFSFPSGPPPPPSPWRRPSPAPASASDRYPWPSRQGSASRACTSAPTILSTSRSARCWVPLAASPLGSSGRSRRSAGVRGVFAPSPPPRHAGAPSFRATDARRRD